MSKKAKKAMVFGTGPTGLLAAAELNSRGFETTVVSATTPTQPPQGAFYFHDLPAIIKAYHPEPDYITYRFAGNHFNYEYKQWDIQYNSSFPLGNLLATERTRGWWPTDELWQELLNLALPKYRKTALLTPDSVLAAAATVDFSVITFPLHHAPFLYSRPVAEVPLESALAVLGDEWTLAPGELFYDGLPAGHHRDIVRISTPPSSYRNGTCFVELTTTALLATTHWANKVKRVPDMHPLQPRLYQTYDIVDKILLAGRFVLGDPKYLSSDVLKDIAKRLD